MSSEQNPFATLSIHSLKKHETSLPPQRPTEIKGENDNDYYVASVTAEICVLTLITSMYTVKEKVTPECLHFCLCLYYIASKHSALPVTKV